MSNVQPSTTYLSLAQLLQRAITPAIGVVADDCQLSHKQIAQALPIISQLLAYQIVQLSKINHQKILTNSLNTLKQLPTVQEINQFDWQQGFNFALVKKLKPHTQLTKKILFSNELQYQQILGVLLVRTQLLPTNIDALLSWCSLLSLKALLDVEAILIPSQFETWLTWQPILLTQPLDKISNSSFANYQDLAWVTGYFDSVSHQSRCYQFAELYRYPSQTQQQTAQQLTDYIATCPFAIAPIAVAKVPKPLAKPSATIQDLPVAQDIFAKQNPSSKPSWADKLQKYWIATTIVTSTVVFGAIGLIAHGSKPSPFEKKSQPTLVSTPKYNDVAIMRVASEPQPSGQTSSQNASTTMVASQTASDKKISKTGKTQTKQTQDKNVENKKPKDKKSSTTKTTSSKDGKNSKDNKKTETNSTDKKSASKSTSKQTVDKKSQNKAKTVSNDKKSNTKDSQPTVKKSTNQAKTSSQETNKDKS